jgi:hypothetical protein
LLLAQVMVFAVVSSLGGAKRLMLLQ